MKLIFNLGFWFERKYEEAVHIAEQTKDKNHWNVYDIWLELNNMNENSPNYSKYIDDYLVYSKIAYKYLR